MTIPHPVYQLVRKVPKGQVTTYGSIGKALGLNPRHVGQILHQNDNSAKTPCHRVVRSDGSIASGYAFGGPGKQRIMLEKEGVMFMGEKVDRRCIITSL